MPHPASLPVDRLLADCTVVRTRRSGPGGQHRNKVETAVVITHAPTGVRAEASERRSQAANLAKATFRLRVELALQVRSNSEEPAPSPSDLWTQRVVGRRIAVNPEHEDFPALLAEALDALADRGWSLADAGDFLGISSSQVVKLLKLESKAAMLLNAERQARGLPPLK
jgi:hypothetical protein